jgi:hypothetical protein
MPANEDEAAWKSEYIALLDKPTSVEVQLLRAQAMKRENAPPFLYRYRKFNEFSESELLEGYVWLSHPDDFNDPFDSALLISEEVLFEKMVKKQPDVLFGKPEVAAFFTEDERKTVRASENPFNTAWDILQSKGSLPFTVPADTAFKAFMEAIQVANSQARSDRAAFLKNTIRIGCFCENFSSVLMWSHYAENHTGICIEYNTEALFKKPLTLSCLHPVIYKSERFDSTGHFDPADVGKVNILSPSLASCHKSPDWSYEREWRLVIPGGLANTNQKFSTDTQPSRILVGAKIKTDDLRKIEALAAKISVPVSVGEMSETNFSITFK